MVQITFVQFSNLKHFIMLGLDQESIKIVYKYTKVKSLNISATTYAGRINLNYLKTSSTRWGNTYDEYSICEPIWENQ